MKRYFLDAVDAMDASVFTGPCLQDAEVRASFSKTLDRWSRALAAEGGPATSAVEVPAGDSLDAITLFFRDYGEKRGSVTVICYGQAWHAWFGSMPEETVREFFTNASEGYMESKLSVQQFRLTKSEEKRMEQYLARIVKRARKFLKGEAQ